jgi:hypothetical protein
MFYIHCDHCVIIVSSAMGWEIFYRVQARFKSVHSSFTVAGRLEHALACHMPPTQRSNSFFMWLLSVIGPREEHSG